ncbi:MAG: hypothetical protein DCC49_10385 [Acidobacteria bacterium]|nr:MAG: hypothetical protein DCC49_10385 [Acidobacteriota bacterium]
MCHSLSRRIVLVLLCALWVTSLSMIEHVSSAAPSDLPLGGLVGTLDPSSTLVDCGRATTRITITETSHLDPGCTYTKGIDIKASGVVLDCRGATIESAQLSGRGIHIVAPRTLALSDVTVRNCIVNGFTNPMRVSRENFKELTPGFEYEHAFSDILIENNLLGNSGGSGLFVDGYVTGVVAQDLEIRNAGSVGVYLEAGSKDNAVIGSHIHDNGYKDAQPEGSTMELLGMTYRYWQTGREGIAIDGSRNNVIMSNTIESNSAGGIFLYKNCGEFYTEKPTEWWTRPYGADGNLIEGNTIRNTFNGVWVGSRMAENQYFMDCSDPAYIDNFVHRVHLDHAAANTVKNNTFENVRYGVRVEDNTATVSGNTFTSTDTAHQAVIVGTRWRTDDLGVPVNGTLIEDNAAEISGNANPYRWIWNPTNSAFADNSSLGESVGWCEGGQPPIDPFLFVTEIVIDDPENTPTPSPRAVLPPLDPCTPPALSGTTVNSMWGSVSVYHAATGDLAAYRCCNTSETWSVEVPESSCALGGGYKVLVSPMEGHQARWYNDKLNWSEADCVDSPSTGLDSTLPASDIITGYVKDAATAADVDGAYVYVYDESGRFVTWARSGRTGPGRYEVQVAPSGSYKVLVKGPPALEDTWHSGASGFAESSPVVAPATANFSLREAATISGNTSSSAFVSAYPSCGCKSPANAVANIAGDYSVKVPTTASSGNVYRIRSIPAAGSPVWYFSAPTIWGGLDAASPAADVDFG